jgi:hypothetical protein
MSSTINANAITNPGSKNPSRVAASAYRARPVVLIVSGCIIGPIILRAFDRLVADGWVPLTHLHIVSMGATYLIVALLRIDSKSYPQCSNAVRGTYV